MQFAVITFASLLTTANHLLPIGFMLDRLFFDRFFPPGCGMSLLILIFKNLTLEPIAQLHALVSIELLDELLELGQVHSTIL